MCCVSCIDYTDVYTHCVKEYPTITIKSTNNDKEYITLR